MKKLTAATYLHYIEVDRDTYIGWNRYWPSIFILNKEALNLLDRVRKGEEIETNEEIDYYLEEFKKYHFIFAGDSDPSKEEFVREVREAVGETDRRAQEFYRDKEAYGSLSIVNDECNLACCYCVNHYNKRSVPAGVSKMDAARKRDIIFDCVDQYMGAAPPADRGNINHRNKEEISYPDKFLQQNYERRAAPPAGNDKEKGENKEASVFFNGGEILLQWDLVKQVVEHVEEQCGKKGIKARFEINTNLTLLTEEIAEFLHRHHFKVHISIDGYKDAHNRTRKYYNGKGSFDDIIEKLKIFRTYYGEKSMDSYQGTIEFPEEFSPEDISEMAQYGFSAARLAPNLLHVSEENARQKARIMGQFLELNTRRDFQVTELLFTRLRDRVNRAEYRFAFNCRGLSGLPDMGIEINLSTLHLSQVCGFAKKAGLPIAELDYDIYNPKLWRHSYKFIKERMESLLSLCMDCSLVGICGGGCLMSGLDNENRLNKAACAYQQEMWEIYVKKAYRDSKK